MKLINLGVTCCLMLGIALAGAADAQAQAPSVYAWLDNDRIIVQSDYGRGHPAANAEVAVFDSVNRQRLLQGRTSAAGTFAFQVPAVVRHGHGLLIEVDGGGGHVGAWSIDASELYAAASLTAGFDQAAIQDRRDGMVRAPTPLAAPGMAMTQGPVTQEQIAGIVQNALELKLAPIREQIASARAPAAASPSASEIIGWIGWAVGLIGILCLIASRRRQRS